MNLKVLILVFSVCLPISLKSQSKFSKLDIVGGISARDYVHGGLRFQYSDFTQLGFYVGDDFTIRSEEEISTYCLDHMLHFGRYSTLTKRPAWYARQGYTFSVNKIDETETRRYSYVNLSAGREFGLSERIGLNFDFGFIWQFREYTKKSSPLETPLNLRWYTYGLARAQLFISF